MESIYQLKSELAKKGVGHVKVKEGQYFAKSGNTGLSSRPHLHAAIGRIVEGKLITLPFRFRDYMEPLQYRIIHPEKYQ